MASFPFFRLVIIAQCSPIELRRSNLLLLLMLSSKMLIAVAGENKIIDSVGSDYVGYVGYLRRFQKPE